MAKLTRYSSFEELKAAPLENPLTPAESAKAHAAFEALLKRLQQEFAAQKSNTAPIELADPFDAYRSDKTADRIIDEIRSSKVSARHSESLDS